MVSTDHEEISTADTRSPSPRVLFVDDDRAILQLFATALDQKGIEAVMADSVAHALEAVETDGERFDVLVVDIALRDGWGSSLALSLREQIPDLEVIYTSGFVWDDPVLADGIEEHMVFLKKPFTVSELTAAIRSAAPPARA